MSEIIAAVDASGRAAGVCVLAGGRVAAERTLDAGRTHSETLLPLLLATLAEAGYTLADVDLYAVTGGPGSFTGLRIGMALVKGLALPGGKPAAAVSTLEALALGAAEEAGLRGTVVAALDARRGEVYWAAFDTAGGFARLTPDAAGPAETLAGALRHAPAPIFVVGDGAEICYTVLQSEFAPGAVRLAGPARPPIARGAALLARGRLPAGPAAALRPRYLRLSQAERQRRARLERPPGHSEA